MEKLRKSGDWGSTADWIASRAKTANRCCSLRSVPASSGASSQGAMPARSRAKASRWEYFRRSDSFPSAHSTGMLRFNVPRAKFSSTGSASLASSRIQYTRSLSTGGCEALFATRAALSPAIVLKSVRRFVIEHPGALSSTAAQIVCSVNHCGQRTANRPIRTLPVRAPGIHCGESIMAAMIVESVVSSRKMEARNPV